MEHIIVSDCPLAADHISQGVSMESNGSVESKSYHPIEVVALTYGIHPSQSHS
jgi:hypothetical protein